MSRARGQSITLGQMRSLRCRDLLVYCRSVECNHSITMNADHLPDDTLVRPLGKRMVCTKCGRAGADVRPDYSPHTSRCARLPLMQLSRSSPPCTLTPGWHPACHAPPQTA